jgi:hypothetical protein
MCIWRPSNDIRNEKLYRVSVGYQPRLPLKTNFVILVYQIVALKLASIVDTAQCTHRILT